jgi:hypothetical protein
MARANRREREERSISRGGAEEPDPWIHNGSGCPVVQEVQRERGEARLPGTCINGEPQRAFAADISERGQWQSGTGCRDADGRDDPRWKACDIVWRQELRHAGIGARTSWMNITPQRRTPSRLLGTPCRTAHRSETWAIPSPCRATPSATSEHLVELLGSSPIPRSFVASCVSFQLRLLPSIGVTRLHCCSDCYRVERTSSRAGLLPLWTTAFSRRTRFYD